MENIGAGVRRGEHRLSRVEKGEGKGKKNPTTTKGQSLSLPQTHVGPEPAANRLTLPGAIRENYSGR